LPNLEQQSPNAAAIIVAIHHPLLTDDEIQKALVLYRNERSVHETDSKAA